MKSLRIGFLLGFRQIQRASIWTTILIIFVMMLTFLNLVAVSGILVGLIAGAEKAVRLESLGDIVITPLSTEKDILQTQALVQAFSAFPEIKNYSVRYTGSGLLEANYKNRYDLSGKRDTAHVNITGIDPYQENQLSGLKGNIVEGTYLQPDDEDSILIGAYYLKKYAQKFGDVFDSVGEVHPGDTVRVTIGDISKEFTVKGIIQSKVDQVSLNTYIPEREFRRLFNRFDRNADQIVIRVNNVGQEQAVTQALLASGFGNDAKIQTYDESKPKFITDIKNTFNILGTLIGSVGIVVASITIFIIVFINALSRRRHIGILKGIGIERTVIEIAYVLQAAFYALVGSLLGMLIVYGFLVGYFEANPIKFPFSDGILVAPVYETSIRFIVLFVITLIAGYIPAWMIVRQNTLSAILGRK